MLSLDSFENINTMVLVAIVAAIVLAFVLVVLIFAVRFKSLSEKEKDLCEKLDARGEKITLLEESMHEVQIEYTSVRKELDQQEEIQQKLKEEIDGYIKQKISKENKVEELHSEIMLLEKAKSRLEAEQQSAKDRIAQLEESLTQASKRNEFWVDQMAEVRTKYDALKLKLR